MNIKPHHVEIMSQIPILLQCFHRGVNLEQVIKMLDWCLHVLLPWLVVHGTCICNNKATLEREGTLTFLIK